MTWPQEGNTKIIQHFEILVLSRFWPSIKWRSRLWFSRFRGIPFYNKGFIKTERELLYHNDH